jgi:hypothetical protein
MGKHVEVKAGWLRRFIQGDVKVMWKCKAM